MGQFQPLFRGRELPQYAFRAGLTDNALGKKNIGEHRAENVAAGMHDAQQQILIEYLLY